MALTSGPYSHRPDGSSGPGEQITPPPTKCYCPLPVHSNHHHSHPMASKGWKPFYLCVKATLQLLFSSESLEDWVLPWRQTCFWSHMLPCCSPQPQVPLPAMTRNSPQVPHMDFLEDRTCNMTFVFWKAIYRSYDCWCSVSVVLVRGPAVPVWVSCLNFV